jgi:hypothetical protein
LNGKHSEAEFARISVFNPFLEVHTRKVSGSIYAKCGVAIQSYHEFSLLSPKPASDIWYVSRSAN